MFGIDVKGFLKRLANKDVAETFDPSTDSLEALQGTISGTANALIAHTGVTTAPGAVGGTSIIDALLIGYGANTYKGMVIEIYYDDTTKLDAQVSSAFNNVTGEITVLSAYKGGQVPAGVKYNVIVALPAQATIIGDLAVPAADVATNILERDVIGNKSDAAVTAVGVVASICAYLKGVLNQIALIKTQTDKLASTSATAIYAHPNSVAEQDALIFVAAKQEINLRFDMNGLAQATTIREYEQVDGVNYRELSAKSFPADFDTGCKAVVLQFVQANALYKVTFQSGILEGGIVNVPYRTLIKTL